MHKIFTFPISSLLLAIWMGISTPALGSDVPPVFSDHAVLQRNIELPVWGRGDAGTVVTVEFAGQKKSTTVPM